MKSDSCSTKLKQLDLAVANLLFWVLRYLYAFGMSEQPGV